MGKRGPWIKKAAPQTIELPLAYALRAEDAMNSLSALLDDGLTVQTVRAARVAIAEASKAEVLLDDEQKEALGLFD